MSDTVCRFNLTNIECSMFYRQLFLETQCNLTKNILKRKKLCWAIVGPTNKKRPLIFIYMAKMIQQQQLNCRCFRVRQVFNDCQHINIDMLPTAPTYNTRRWSNHCLISGHLSVIRCSISPVTPFDTRDLCLTNYHRPTCAK